ncbi:MAG: hypothetical protein GEV09_03950 [Pseudonocardiaceae bacterium]|nr:hypothetical protein [Pseudonocardiaceae bacterium]
MPRLARSDWYDLTRDMNWTLANVDEEEARPKDLSNSCGVPAEKWWVWDEPNKITYPVAGARAVRGQPSRDLRQRHHAAGAEQPLQVDDLRAVGHGEAHTCPG